MATNLKDASWLPWADQTSQLVTGAWYIEQRKSSWQAKQTVGSQELQASGEKYLSPEWPQPGTDFRRWLLSLMASTLFTHSFPTAHKGYVCRAGTQQRNIYLYMTLFQQPQQRQLKAASAEVLLLAKLILKPCLQFCFIVLISFREMLQSQPEEETESRKNSKMLKERGNR